MAYVRRATTKDATWNRAWTADAVVDLAAIQAAGLPMRGDVAYVTANTTWYVWQDDGLWQPLNAAGLLVGATLAANVLASSLTSVGTLTGGATGAGFTVALTTSTITGTLADARLSANVPLINAANTWTAQNIFSGANPLPRIQMTGTNSFAQCSFYENAGGTQLATFQCIGSTFATVSRRQDFELIAIGTGRITFRNGSPLQMGAWSQAGGLYVGPNTTDPGVTNFQVDGTSILTGAVSSAASILSSSASGGLGYKTGAGGTVTQITSKATTVVLNTICGQITMNNAALLASTTVAFTLTNSTIAATDVILFNHVSGGTVGSYLINGQCAAGSATVDVRNISLGNLSEAVVLTFIVIKAVTS